MKTYLAALAVVIGAAACSPGPSPRSSDVLVVARYFNATTLDPAVGFTGNDVALLDEIYEQLFDIAEPAGGAEVVGELAKSWLVSPDGLAIDIKLKADRRFADGTLVDAAAVAYSLRRTLAMDRGPASYLTWLDRVEVLSPEHVRLVLKRPFAPALELLTLSPASIVNPKQTAAHDVGDYAAGWLSDHSAGSGLYQILRHRSGEETVLVANAFSARKVRQFKRVEIRAVPDEGVRRLLLERGDADIADPVPAALVARYGALPGVTTLTEQGGTSLSFIVLNTERPLLQNPAVRRAIASSIDYDALRRLILKNNAIQIPGYLPPGAPGFDPAEPAPRRDLAGAHELLRSAKYDDSTPLVMLVGQLGPVAEFIQSNLREAGMNIRLQRIAPSALAAARASGSFDLLYDGWSLDVPDPALYLEALFASRNIGSGTNMSRYRNPQVDALIDRALAESGAGARTAMFREIDATLRRDRPLIMIFGANPVVSHRTDIGGLVIRRLRPLYTCFECLWREATPAGT